MNKLKTTSVDQLKSKLIELGVDDVGFVNIDSPLIADQREDILKIYPQTKSLISFVIAMNIDAIQTRNKPIMNYEWKFGLNRLHESAFKVTRYINENGAAAIPTVPGFPMDMSKWGDEKIWDISHKPIAFAAGLGTIGVNRFVLHPKFGAFVGLGTILTDMEFDEYDKPLEKEVCLYCYLCVQNCPAHALSKKGIDFIACLNNTYRYFMPGFLDFVKDIVKSKSIKQFEKKWTDDEILQIWQSLTYEGYYNAGHCMAVCPAHLGKDYDKEVYAARYNLPIKSSDEKIYIVDKKSERKLIQRILPRTCRQAIELSFLYFRSEKAKGVNAIIQFNIKGKEVGNWYTTIKDETCIVSKGVHSNPTLTITSPSDVWLKISRKEKNATFAYILRQFKAKGDKKLLMRLTTIFD